RPRRDGPEHWVRVNIVEVHEIGAREDVDPIDWMLITTEPIETIADVQAIVDAYRTRWLIEEFFKAIKTGCQFEKRELESYDAITNLLAMCCPIAWQMLFMRNVARTAPETPASEVLRPSQIEVLRSYAMIKIPAHPTIREALFAIAGIGGHHTKKDPGWTTIGRGMERLLPG